MAKHLGTMNMDRGMKSTRGKGKHLARRGRGFVVTVLVLIVLGSLGGCGKKQIAPPKMTFRIEADEQTNRGQPFYVVFRSIQGQQFITESYRDIADMVFANPPNASVLGNQVVLPGEEHEIVVEQPVKENVGIYGLYTEPGEQWKIMLSQPLEEQYVVKFEHNRMTVAKRKGFIRRCCLFGL
jgi:hypothetical protein